MNSDKIDPKQEQNAEPKISKDELSDKDVEKVTGGIVVTKVLNQASPKLYGE